MKSIKKKKTEESMHIALAQYIKLQYPDVIFTSESSGIRVNMGQAVKMKKLRSVGKLPDVIILQPSGHYHGLALELKATNASPFLKDGSLSTNEHVREQAKMLDRLKNKGYCAHFVVGLDQAKAEVDNYLNPPF